MTNSLPDDLESYAKELIRLGIRRFPSETRKCSPMRIVVTKGHCVDIDVPEELRMPYREQRRKVAMDEISGKQ